jgi:hypothetical protein
MNAITDVLDGGDEAGPLNAADVRLWWMRTAGRRLRRNPNCTTKRQNLCLISGSFEAPAMEYLPGHEIKIKGMFRSDIYEIQRTLDEMSVGPFLERSVICARIGGPELLGTPLAAQLLAATGA